MKMKTPTDLESNENLFWVHLLSLSSHVGKGGNLAGISIIRLPPS